MTKRLMSLMALGLLLSAVGWGYTIDLLTTSIPGARLWNTGFDSDGAYGDNDKEDGHYTWVRWTNGMRTTPQASGSAYIINDSNYPFSGSSDVWRSNITDKAAWVSYRPGPVNLNSEAWFSYYTSFTLPSTFSLWNVSITLDLWADNKPEFVGLYNSSNVLLSSDTPSAPSGSPPLGFVASYDSDGLLLSHPALTPGTYTIRFDVYNAPGYHGNVTGLFTLFHSATATGYPEPGTYALMGTVGLALYLLRRRKAAAKN